MSSPEPGTTGLFLFQAWAMKGQYIPFYENCQNAPTSGRRASLQFCKPFCRIAVVFK